MASVTAQVEVITRAGDPTQHLLEQDVTSLFTLSTTDTTYTTDTTAFSTTVYSYFSSQVGAANVSNVELRWRVWLGGTSSGGGTITNDGVFNNQAPASATDVQTELNTHIAHALTLDVQPPGQ